VSPITHLLGSWLVASVVTDNPRDRKLVTLAGVLPDADGLGLLVDVVRGFVSGAEPTFHYYHKFHHLLLHGWPGGIAIILLLACFGRNHLRVALYCLIMFHLHLLCDLVGSRGPSLADLWPINYGEPLFRHPIWIWKRQWKLDGWQNQAIFIVVLGVSLWLTVKRGYSVVELVGRKTDAAFVAVLRKWRVQLLARKAQH